MAAIKKIITGGQTGVDQAALDVALTLSIPCGGWCPPGRICENGVISEKYPLNETPCDRSPLAPDVPRSQRTEWNVRDADAVLILYPLADPKDKGTLWTIACAKKREKPLLVADPYDSNSVAFVTTWLVQLRGSLILNIAGPPESLFPGIYQQTKYWLSEILKQI